ncbi:MAG: DoxX family protein [Bacteroidota bacterium]|nr:DoxX family protein [Bacteroidota bacterium]
MNTFEEISAWGDKHHPIWIDLFRVALGLMLIVTGIQTVVSPQNTALVIGGETHNFLGIAIIHYIVLTHFAGGIVIALGLITRVPLLLTLPILLLAVIFSNVPEMGVFSEYANFFVALAMLLANVAFLIYGSGAYSLDNYMRKHPGS